MRGVRPGRSSRTPNFRAYMALAVGLLATGSAGCTSDAVNPTEPPTAGIGGSASAGVRDESPIIVSNSAELAAAMTPENAGRRIRVRAGLYSLTQPLVVPDGVTLEGEGVMLYDGEGLPTGFAEGTRTTLAMTANTPGDILSLGNGVTIRALAIEDMVGRIGNAIVVLSRSAADRVSAGITETEIVNPNAHGPAPSGPAGCGVALLTLNPQLGGDPPPHAGATISARVTRSLIRSTATGVGCGLFAFNFAPGAAVSVTLERNVVGGGIIAAGGVSRPDPVHDSRTVIWSGRNFYRDDSNDPCVSRRLGWNLQGGSGSPMPGPIAETARNTLRLHSVNDRIAGFTTAVFATGGRRFFGSPLAGDVTDNSMALELIGTNIITPSCDGVSVVADFRLAGAWTGGSFAPGNGNTLHAIIRGVRGSGPRSNLYADVLGPSGPAPAADQGSGNRLELVGNPQAFARTNRAIEPAPGAEFFTHERR